MTLGEDEFPFGALPIFRGELLISGGKLLVSGSGNSPKSHVWGRSFCDQGHHFAAHFLDLSGGDDNSERRHGVKTRDLFNKMRL